MSDEVTEWQRRSPPGSWLLLGNSSLRASDKLGIVKWTRAETGRKDGSNLYNVAQLRLSLASSSFKRGLVLPFMLSSALLSML